MFFWIIQNIIISIILIMSIHYTYIYFKTNLTVPKTKDLVKKPIEQYRKIYNSIQKEIPKKIIIVGLGGIGLLAGAGALNGTGQGQGDATESSHFLAPSGYNGKAAFNNSLAQYDCWHSHTNGLPQWIEFRFPYDVILTSYKIWPRYTSPSNPSNWELRGFENGSSSYTTIHSQSSVSGWQATNQNSIASGSHYKEFPVNTTTAYRTFRLHITGAAAGSYVTIGELAFYGYIDNTSSGNIYSSSIVVEEVETDVIYNLSDDRLKHNEEEIPNALDLLNDLKPYKYQKTKISN